MMNKYLNRLNKLIGEYRDFELKQFMGPGDRSADFDDLLWYHIDPNTRRQTRYLCCRHGVKGQGESLTQRPELKLASPYDHLLKVWIIEVVNEPISASEKQARISIARKLLSLMGGDLYCQTIVKINSLKLGKRSNDRLRPFINFCSGKGLMPQLELLSCDDRDRTGHAQLENSKAKLPSIHSVLALGDIFSRVFEPVNLDGSVKAGKEVHMTDALLATFACLSLASPNRTAAEVTVLPKQRLHSYSENQGEPVYYLDWVGSKDHKDYKNHLLAALREPIEKSLNFFHEACEPARILCRFYENPNQSLGKLLGGFKIEAERQRHLSLAARPNMFQFGYALGFYEVDECVHVLKDGVDPTSRRPNFMAPFFEKKPIHSLKSQDKLSSSGSNSSRSSYASLYRLFKADANVWPFRGSPTVTVEDVQKWWITHYTKAIIPEFPISYSSAETHIRLKDAMFCFLGSWFYGDVAGKGSGGKKYQSSPYAVVPLHAFGTYSISRFTGSNKRKTIFEKYGISAEVRLKPHSLRHFANTLADKSEIPVEVITAWSGRVNPEQTHTYIHTSHEEKAERVRSIINPPGMDSRNIRVVSASSIASATNLPASITSTGVCTQDLNVMPCNFLNDFVAQCFMCPESCHIAGDEESIAFLEKDLAFQNARLEAVVGDVRLSNSQAMRRWYVIHSGSTHVLSVLIELMRKSPKDTIIRYSGKTAEFSLIELDTNSITKVACALPDAEELLKRVLEQKSNNSEHKHNPQLNSVLSNFGLA